jgi:S-formylglutathione hydrolase FrmB
MSLTGSVFLTAILTLTVAAFVGAVVLWPRMSGPEPASIAGRAGVLLVVNALVLLTAATRLNADFQFFSDWTDLAGAFAHAPSASVLQGGTSASRAARIAVPRSAAGPAASSSVLPAVSAGAATVASFTVSGPQSGITGSVVVQLPPGYSNLRNAQVRYPVLETFQGYPGSPYQWVNTMDLGGVMGSEVAAKHMRAALIVSPQVEIPAGADTECVNGPPGTPQLETWLTQDVPNWVANTFRVRTDRGSWATLGLSAGGWCAAMATMLHPDRYSAAVVLAGYFHPEFGPFYDPYPAGSSQASRYDLVALARKAPPPVALWVQTSRADRVSYSSSQALLRTARAPLAVTATVLQHAGHRLTVWQQLLPGALTWLGANIPGFSPSEGV